MKKVIRTIGMLLICGVLCMPVAEARGRNGNNGNGHHNTPAHNSSHNNNHNSRPGNHNSRPGNHNRPAQPNRPQQSNGPQQPNRPPHQHKPVGGGNHAHYYRPTPPPKPHIPHMSPYHRPAPPRAWRPPVTWRPFHSILGVAFGSAINASLNLLLNSGYTISSYGPDAIYLTNVPMLNCYWPDATMYYNGGALAGSKFIYYTPVANPARYNMVFNSLTASYGAPISVATNGGIITASWWGPGNQYISLTYGGQYAANGNFGYYTTLTFGI